MKRQEHRLDPIEAKLAQISTDEVRDAWTLEKINDESERLLEKISQNREELDD